MKLIVLCIPSQKGLLLEYAKKVGLDIDKFKKEMSEHVYAPLINKSLKDGIDSGVEVSLLTEYIMKTHGI